MWNNLRVKYWVVYVPFCRLETKFFKCSFDFNRIYHTILWKRWSKSVIALLAVCFRIKSKCEAPKVKLTNNITRCTRSPPDQAPLLLDLEDLDLLDLLDQLSPSPSPNCMVWGEFLLRIVKLLLLWVFWNQWTAGGMKATCFKLVSRSKMNSKV